jgi:hypothetical protein
MHDAMIMHKRKKRTRKNNLEIFFWDVTDSSRATTKSSGRLLHMYDTVMHGFAIRLTDDEARHMSMTPGVSGVYKDTAYYT